MRARDIMTRDVVTVTPNTPVREAVALLAEHAITSLPVIDEDRNIVGIVSELDLLRDRMPHDPTATMTRRHEGPDPARYVKQIMHEPVICLSQEVDTADLAQILTDNNVRAIPIIDGPDLVGIVSRRDVLRTVLRDDTAIEADVRQRLAAYTGVVVPSQPESNHSEHDRWQVKVEDGVVTVRGHFDDDHQADTVDTLVHTVPGVVRGHIKRTRRS